VAVAAVLLGGLGVLGVWLLNSGSETAPSPTEYRQTPAPTNTQPAPVADNGKLDGADIFEANKYAAFQIYLYKNGVHVGWGSGFFIDPDGTAVTNHHVMVGMDSAKVVMHDKREFDITGYYSYDIDNDLAVIKVDGKGGRFDAVTIREDAVRPGEQVYAIGGPDGEPLTITGGEMSIIVEKPIEYGIYAIPGMLQTTASIYGGNSGGPLFDTWGRVIGINSATHIERDSQQWAVPIGRVQIPEAGADINRLPLGTSMPQWDGRVAYLRQFPQIPDFLSVSRNASLLLAGTADDLGHTLTLDFDGTGAYHFEYAYYYALDESYFIPDTNEYDDILGEHGFLFQHWEIIDSVRYAFLYNSSLDMSLVYGYYDQYEIMFLTIGRGNAYQRLLGGGAAQTPNNIGGYANFPSVPDFGVLSPSSRLADKGYAYELGFDNFRIEGDLWIAANDYVYLYNAPPGGFLAAIVMYEAQLSVSGFELAEIDFYFEDNAYAALYQGPNGLTVALIRFYDSDELCIAIG
jgi:hypothetical protein